MVQVGVDPGAAVLSSFAVALTPRYNPGMRPALCRFISVVWATAICVVAAIPLLGQGTSNGTLTIGDLRVTGEEHIGSDRVLAEIGLKPGDVFLVKQLNLAAARMSRSGVFEEVSYTYTPHGTQVEVEFKVHEVSRFRKCAFDNFVWASDDELERRLEQRIPLYAGEAPETGEILEQMTRELEALSKEKGVEVRVERLPEGNIGSANWIHLFTAQGVHIRMRSVRFSGVISVSPKELERQVAELVGKDYSAVRSRVLASAALLPFYRERGYLRAILDVAPQILNHTEGSDEFDIEVVYTIQEGNVYRWLSPEWKGNQRKTAAELEGLLGLKPGSVANGKMIDQGWETIQRAYGKDGYIDARLSTHAIFDEASRQVHYVATVSEGSQFRMGGLQVLGVPAAAAERLKNKWRLKTGDVFDAFYLSDFLKKDAPGALSGVFSRGSRIKTGLLRDHERNVVDVTIELE